MNTHVRLIPGEFQLRLRQLEKSLLSALNESKGRILDDDSIITHLETLKKEAAEINQKVEETDIVMAEVDTVSQQYSSLAQSCSSIYFTLESLNQVNLFCIFVRVHIQHACVRNRREMLNARSLMDNSIYI